MLFNSYEFLLLFLPLTLAGFFALGRVSHWLAGLWLALASLFFYGWWNPAYVVLLLASIAANFWLGKAIGHAPRAARGPLLVAGLTGNLLLLAYFKYAAFLLSAADAMLQTHWLIEEIVLPLGISFFTFTQIAYLVDVYRGVVCEYRLVHYLLFVTYFPHLIAGPVLHHKDMMPQFSQAAIYRPNPAMLAAGLSCFVIGLAKKVLLADNLGDYAGPFFGEAKLGLAPGFSDAWVGALAYTLQLYFDFSGYSDMAIGLSWLFGVHLPINFASPYRAANIIEFWRRWHMTLSTFLRDYLYIPLGGSRHGVARRYFNLLLTMLLGGLWHGANWTFVAWGAVHGFYLCINHAWLALPRLARLTESRAGQAAARLLTFLSVVVAWVFFRADDFSTAFNVIAGLLGQNGWQGQTSPVREQAVYWLLAGLAIAHFAPNSQTILRSWAAGVPGWSRLLAHPVWLGCLFALSVSRLAEKSEFLYFQF